jgi:hypothetical protein
MKLRRWEWAMIAFAVIGLILVGIVFYSLAWRAFGALGSA